MRFPKTVSLLVGPLSLIFAVSCFAAPVNKPAPSKALTPAQAAAEKAALEEQTRLEPKAEPPAQYELQINGKPVSLTLEKEMWVGMKAGPTRVKLVRSPLRQFDKNGVRFQYPVDYTFEADVSNPNVLIWTLSGTNSALMVQQFSKAPANILIDGVTSEAIKLYGRNNVRISSSSMAIGSRQIKGKRLNVTLAKQKLMQEFYAFNNSQNSFVLMIQDSSGKGWQTQEVRRLKNLLYSSLRW